MIVIVVRALLTLRSRPARGAWIEMLTVVQIRKLIQVAPRTGRVD